MPLLKTNWTLLFVCFEFKCKTLLRYALSMKWKRLQWLQLNLMSVSILPLAFFWVIFIYYANNNVLLQILMRATIWFVLKLCFKMQILLAWLLILNQWFLPETENNRMIIFLSYFFYCFILKYWFLMWFVLYLFICSFYFSFWNETKIYTHTQLTSLDVKIPNGIASIMKPKNKINRIHHESIWYPISPEIKIIHGIVCAMRPTTKFLLHEIIVNAKLIRLLLKKKTNQIYRK